MTSIIEKRRSLHKDLASHQQENSTLKLQLSQLQALANIGTTTCMIAHEINNLLTPLSSYADLALANPNDKGLTEKVLQKTSRNCRRASKVMESILSVANGETNQKEDTNLYSLVEEIFTCLCRNFEKDSITVHLDIPKDLTIRAVPVDIQQVLMNLILNARDSMLEAGGSLTIKAQDNTDNVQIEVTDTGCGIDPGDLENIFEPFFTTKADKRSSSQISGSGIGLAFCKKIMDIHQGSISVNSIPANGTSFIITLPKLR